MVPIEEGKDLFLLCRVAAGLSKARGHMASSAPKPSRIECPSPREISMLFVHHLLLPFPTLPFLE